MKKWLYRLFLIFIGLFIGLEFMVFCFNLYTRHWFRIKIKIDPDTYKILCLGESTVAGCGASSFSYDKMDLNKSFPGQLQSLLEKKYKIQVFNMGICGTTASEILKNLELNLSYFKPNMVVYLAGNNGYDMAVIPALVNKNKLASLINSFRLVRLLKLVYFFGHNFNRIKNDDHSHFINRLYVYYRNKQLSRIMNKAVNYEIHSENSGVHADVITALKFLKSYGCNVLVLNYFNSSYANNFLLNTAKELNLPFIDNEKVYKEYLANCWENDLICHDGWHPSDKGYYLIAKNIYDNILEKKIIPEKWLK